MKLNSSSSKKEPTKKKTGKDHKLDFISLQNQSGISEVKFKKYGKARQSKMILKNPIFSKHFCNTFADT